MIQVTGPGEILESDARTDPEGRISAGGAEKAERRRALGAARPVRPSSEAVSREKKGQKMGTRFRRWSPLIETNQAKSSWNLHKTGNAQLVRSIWDLQKRWK
jgi:hypothetical protein